MIRPTSRILIGMAMALTWAVIMPSDARALTADVSALVAGGYRCIFLK